MTFKVIGSYNNNAYLIFIVNLILYMNYKLDQLYIFMSRNTKIIKSWLGFIII